MKDGLYYATQFREKKLSVTEWIDDREKQVKQLNPELNAFVDWDAVAAKRQYESKGAGKGPFFGLPIPLKMLGQDKTGMKSSSGSRLFVENRATTTTNFVKGLEGLGFIPLGKTNAPEFGFKNISDPTIYGSARNPWNLAYSPGGSSGGAAAAVASGLFPMAGASDGGGSIRIPASFSGLIGLKPTRGSMPVGPDGWRGWQGASIDFALTVSMRDTETLFYHLRGTEKAAPYQAPKAEWSHQKAAEKKVLKIAFLTESPVGTPVSQEAVKAIQNATAFLEQQGHEVTEIPYPVNGRQLIDSYYLMNGAETVAMFEGIQQGIKRPLTKEDMELMTWGIYQYGRQLLASDYVRALQLWDQAAYKMEQLFERYDLFLTPTTADIAPKVDAELQSEQIRKDLDQAESLSLPELQDLVYDMFEKSLTITPFTQLANLTGQPAISLPTHVAESGLPLGIQFMASKGREDLLFQVGKLFEQEQKFLLPKYYRES
ncbi:amidase [Enterococcus quebecensis]|uniref:Amidase n=1 Tax=Enterococcus quebecensis TaxID=903983 RepID=A0A1E5GV28_9ENTE|nr:amidase [Enterococcus quebecensis]OEG16519.1 amidase [Enterococcus quebecensis]OJG74107.1 glutamyl-tRNA(Gln) amidotransferase, A subunit [Enterococcus quebecensis]